MSKKKKDPVLIVPNYYGLAFGAGIIACLITASTYSNNLVYALSFFMVGLFLISMIQANSNLKSLVSEKIEFQIVEEGGTAKAFLWLKNATKEDKYLLRVKIPAFGKDFHFFVDKIEAGDSKKVSFEFNGGKPGVYEVEKISIASVFPLGMFYSWKVYKLKTNYYVYPKPENKNKDNVEVKEGSSRHHVFGTGGEDFSEHKQYERGESIQHIDWKALARGRGLLSKKFQDGDDTNYLLKVKSNASLEDLRDTAYWVEKCKKENLSFALDVRNSNLLNFGYGELQRQKALKILAQESVDAI